MHIFPLILLILSSFAVYFVARYFHLVSKITIVLADYFSFVEDQWSWSTEDGRSYEDVDLMKIEGDEVVLQHRDGVARVAVASLTEPSRARLFRSALWREQELPFAHGPAVRNLQVA